MFLLGSTRTDLALYKAEEELFCDTCGMRADSRKLLLVVTDGKSNYGSDTMTNATRGLKVCSVAFFYLENNISSKSVY